jgi:hypothetical protein
MKVSNWVKSREITKLLNNNPEEKEADTHTIVCAWFDSLQFLVSAELGQAAKQAP